MTSGRAYRARPCSGSQGCSFEGQTSDGGRKSTETGLVLVMLVRGGIIDDYLDEQQQSLQDCKRLRKIARSGPREMMT